MKALAWYIIFLIIIIGISIFGIGIVFYNYLAVMPMEASKTACQFKYLNYCFRWMRDNKEPADWNEIEPKNCCEKFNICKPKKEDCEKIFRM